MSLSSSDEDIDKPLAAIKLERLYKDDQNRLQKSRLAIGNWKILRHRLLG